jgi:hypothetical protein
MAFPGTLDISYYQGDSHEFIIRPKNSDGSIFDLTGFSAKFYIANKRGSGATQYECLTSIASDSIICIIPPAQGRNLVAGTTYYYDVQVSKTINNTVLTLLTGKITVTADISGAV